MDTHIKVEQKYKRPHDEDEPFQTNNNSDTKPPKGQQQQQQESKPNVQPEKKKFKVGIPNWKHIKKDGNANKKPWRYLDEDIFDMRQKCVEIIRSRANKLVDWPIYSLSCNVMCRARRTKIEKQFVPLEFSIYAYKVGKGCITKPYHCFVNSGPPPFCCSIDAKEFSSFHKIPFLPDQGGYLPEARTDYKDIYKEMLDYTRPGEYTVLVSHREMEQVIGSLMWLYDRATEDGVTKLPKVTSWTILPIDEYVNCLYNTVYQNFFKITTPKFGLLYYLDMQLESSIMDHNENYKCPFHRTGDSESIWCAQSCAMRKISNIENLLDEVDEMYKAYMAPPPQEEPMEQQAQLEGQGCQQQPMQIVPEQEQVLAIEAPRPENLIADNDPRLHGRLPVTTEAPVSMVFVNDGSAPAPYVAPPKPAPKKTKGPIIIASTAHRSDDLPDCY